MTRTLPENIKAEEALIGAMLLNEACVVIGAESVNQEDFYSPANGAIFGAIRSLYVAGLKVDAVSVSDVLQREKQLDRIGGASKLIQIQSEVASISEAAAYAYAKIVHDHSVLRRAIAVASEIADGAYSRPEDVDAFVLAVENKVYELNDIRGTDSAVTVGDAAVAGLDRLEHLFRHGNSITGIPTGFTKFDSILSGFQPGAFYIVGARPAMGKTAFAMGVAAHIAVEQNIPVAFFSLEMSQNELFQRILAERAMVDSVKIKNGNLFEEDWDRILPVFSKLQSSPLIIDDNPGHDVVSIRSKCRKIRQQYGDLGLVVVDYLQLLASAGRTENRQQEVSAMSRALKMLARELDCSVMALSQLSRGLESRSDKRPMLSDLRESGSLEQDADAVMFLYRDEVYNAESPAAGVAELIVAKHRSGPNGIVHLGFAGSYTKFLNVSNAGDE